MPLTKALFCGIVYNVATYKKQTNKQHNMQHKHMATDAVKSEFFSVYFYLAAGIMLATAVFVFVPRVATG
jgi:hypothetical protein